ncbi:MAG: alpha/beta hydrolase [Solirubrobacteraceae bacterium]|nr:alpha/beta hydrolase [Solirubrobacteraceae bacterium]
MPIVEGAGVELAYEERGAGPAVLLVHGMGEDRRAWADVAAALAGGARAIAYDRRGYGDSGAPEPYRATTVNEQAEDAAALLRALGAGPAVACGRDLGALVVIDLLQRHADVVRAGVLLDPAAFPLVPEANEALAAERDLLERTLRGDGGSAAVAAWHAARGRPDAPPAAPRAFFADFGGQSTLPLTRRGLREVEAPVVVLDTPTAPPHVRAAADALAALLPDADRGTAADPVGAIRALI